MTDEVKYKDYMDFKDISNLSFTWWRKCCGFMDL